MPLECSMRGYDWHLIFFSIKLQRSTADFSPIEITLFPYIFAFFQLHIHQNFSIILHKQNRMILVTFDSWTIYIGQCSETQKWLLSQNFHDARIPLGTEGRRTVLDNS